MKGCACLSPTVEVKGQPGAQPPLALSSLLAKNDLEILILAAMDHHGDGGTATVSHKKPAQEHP